MITESLSPEPIGSSFVFYGNKTVIILKGVRLNESFVMETKDNCCKIRLTKSTIIRHKFSIPSRKKSIQFTFYALSHPHSLSKNVPSFRNPFVFQHCYIFCDCNSLCIFSLNLQYKCLVFIIGR